MNNKQILSIFVVGFLTMNFFSIVNYASADRYQSKCDVNMIMPPEDYLRDTSRMWNYDLDSMPKFLKDAYECVNWVHIQDKAGIVDSGSPFE